MEKLLVGVESGFWYNPENPDESMRFIKECGFEAVDFSFNALYRQSFDTEKLTSFYDQSIEELFEYFRPLKEAAEKHGIRFPQTHGIYPVFWDDDEAVTNYNIGITNKLIALCEFLGCEALVVHPATQPELHKEAELENNLNVYRQWIPAAKKHGVKVCLENLFFYYDMDIYEGTCSNVKEACWYIDTLNAEAGEDVFGFCLDVGHAVVTGANLYQYIMELGKRLTVLHIQDNDGNCDSHMMPYTQMDKRGKRLRIDWEKFTRGLREIGYEGPLCFESAHGVQVMPEEVHIEGFRLMSAIGKYFRKRISESYWTQSPKNIYVAAHRGWPDKYPENTMESFRAAEALGVDQIEFDVRVTKDNELVIIHDATVDRTTNGSGLVCEKTLAELKELDAGSHKCEEFKGCKIPTLIEFMEFIKNNKEITLDVELKEYPTEGHEEIAYSVCDRVLKIIDDYGFTDRVVLNTFSGKLHEYIYKKYGKKYRQHVYYPQSNLGECELDPYSYAYCCCMFSEGEKVPMASKEEFDEMLARGVQPWAGAGVKTAEDVAESIRCGAYLITCNNPDEILKYLREQGCHK